jgi:hypothetical protein
MSDEGWLGGLKNRSGGGYLKNKEQGGGIYRREIIDFMHVYLISPSNRYIV